MLSALTLPGDIPGLLRRAERLGLDSSRGVVFLWRATEARAEDGPGADDRAWPALGELEAVVRDLPAGDEDPRGWARACLPLLWLGVADSGGGVAAEAYTRAIEAPAPLVSDDARGGR